MNLDETHRLRRELLTASMRSYGVDAIVLIDHHEIEYLTPAALSADAPIALVIVDDAAPVFISAAEDSLVAVDSAHLVVVHRRDGEDPLQLVAGLVGCRRHVAVGSSDWASTVRALVGLLPEVEVWDNAATLCERLHV